MSFSSEHYIKVAEVIRGLPRGMYLSEEPMITIGQVVGAFREMFEKDNPRFDPVKFVDACYTEDWG